MPISASKVRFITLYTRAISDIDTDIGVMSTLVLSIDHPDSKLSLVHENLDEGIGVLCTILGQARFLLEIDDILILLCYIKLSHIDSAIYY